MRLLCWAAAFTVLLALCPVCAQAQEDGLYQASGAGELYDGLDRETKGLLEKAGVESALGSQIDGLGLFQALSQLVREKLAGPLKGLAALVGTIILCRLSGCFEAGELSGTVEFCGTAACGAVMAGPVLGMLSLCETVTRTACAFLTGAVPVYTGLLAASGSGAAGSGYSVLAMAAGAGLPVLEAGVVLPLLRVYLALSVCSAASGAKLGSLTSSLYSFGKWALVMGVTVFTGILSVQAVVNGQVDAAAAKAAKLALSSGVPIVGGALGDAVGAIQNSVRIVKSGVGAFGILAAVCIFLPAMAECFLWSLVCTLGQAAGDLFEAPRISGLLEACGGVVKMVLALMASVCAVCVASAAAVVTVNGGG